MFVGSVDWLVNLATDLSCCRVTIFDLISETVVWDSKNCDADVWDVAMEISCSGFGDYEVESYDIWTGETDTSVHMEINIAIDEEDE